MILHIILLAIVVFIATLWTPKQKRKNAVLCSFVFFSLIAFRNNGSVDDAAVYVPMYKMLSGNNEGLVGWVEPFTQLLILISTYFGWSVKGLYALFAFLSALFLSLSLPYFIKNRSQNILYWIGLFLLHYLSCANVIVQVLSSAMLTYFVVLQLKGYKKLSFILFVLLSFVHSASIIAIVLWFAINYRDKLFTKRKMTYIPILCLAIGLLGGIKFVLVYGADWVPDQYKYLVDAVIQGESLDKKGILIALTLTSFLYTVMHINIKTIDYHQKAACIATAIYLSFYVFSFGVLFLFRIAYYFIFFSPFTFAYIPLKKDMKILFSMFLITYFIYTLFHFDTLFITNYTGSINLWM